MSERQKPEHPGPWMTTREAAEYLRCSERTVRNACMDGRLRYARAKGIRNPFRFKVEWLDEFLEPKPPVDEESQLNLERITVKRSNRFQRKLAKARASRKRQESERRE